MNPQTPPPTGVANAIAINPENSFLDKGLFRRKK